MSELSPRNSRRLCWRAGGGGEVDGDIRGFPQVMKALFGKELSDKGDDGRVNGERRNQTSSHIMNALTRRQAGGCMSLSEGRRDGGSSERRNESEFFLKQGIRSRGGRDIEVLLTRGFRRVATARPRLKKANQNKNSLLRIYEYSTAVS